MSRIIFRKFFGAIEKALQHSRCRALEKIFFDQLNDGAGRFIRLIELSYPFLHIRCIIHREGADLRSAQLFKIAAAAKRSAKIIGNGADISARAAGNAEMNFSIFDFGYFKFTYCYWSWLQLHLNALARHFISPLTIFFNSRMGRRRLQNISCKRDRGFPDLVFRKLLKRLEIHRLALQIIRWGNCAQLNDTGIFLRLLLECFDVLRLPAGAADQQAGGQRVQRTAMPDLRIDQAAYFIQRIKRGPAVGLIDQHDCALLQLRFRRKIFHQAAKVAYLMLIWQVLGNLPHSAMKSFVWILLLLTITSGNVNAQSWQIGAQQGVSYWLTRKVIGVDRLRTLPGQHLTWDKALTLRYQTRKKLGFKIDAGTYHFRQHTPGAADSILAVNGDTYALTLRMGVMYDVTYPLLSYMFPRMAGMKSYIGFTCAPSLLWDDAIITNTADESDHLCRNRFGMWVGFSYTHEVPLSKKVLLVSEFAFEGRPFIKYRIDEDVLPVPNKRISVQSGLRFKL